MSDDKKNYRKGPDGKVIIRVEKPGAGGGSKGESGKEGGSDTKRKAGQIHGAQPPPRLSDDIYVPDDEPYLYFYDLGTQFVGGPQPSYVERKGLIPVDRNINPILGVWDVTYTDEDYKEWEDSMLGSLLGEGHGDVSPLGTSTVETAGRKRKVSNVWPWSWYAMGEWPPQSLRLNTKPGVPLPPYPLTLKNWRQQTIEGEDWAPINTEHGMAPNWGYWEIPHNDRYAHIFMFDSRYRRFDTSDTDEFKVTRESNFDANVVEFKMEWPLKIYAVPDMLGIAESNNVTFQKGGGAQYTKREIYDRGTFPDGRPFYWQRTTTERSVLYQFESTHTFGEGTLYPLIRDPLFPDPHIIALTTHMPSAASVLAQIPSSMYKTYRRWRFTLEYQKGILEERIFSGGVSPRRVVLSIGPRRRTITNAAHNIEDERFFGDVFEGRRPISDLTELRALALNTVKAEISADMGQPFDGIAGSYSNADGSYSGTASLPIVSSSYAPPFYDPFNAFAGQERPGQLVALIVCNKKRYYVWRRE